MPFTIGWEPPNKGHGEGIKFLRDHVNDADGPCLIWPFFRDPLNGDGRLGHLGKMWKAHRLMCILAHGEPPTPKHMAAHSCGKRHEGCVHPKHLSWKTARENQADMVVHGTTRKKGTPRRKLTQEQVDLAWELKGNKTIVEIAELLGVKYPTIHKIFQGITWADRRRQTGKPIPPIERAQKAVRARQLYAGGMTLEAIATELDISRGTVRGMVDAE